MPCLLQHQLSALKTADYEGREFLLKRMGRERWLTRQTEPGGQAEEIEWSEDFQMIRQERSGSVENPVKQDWFISAVKKYRNLTRSGRQPLSKDMIIWTEPYFSEDQEQVGITASVRFQKTGQEYVIGIDALLKDIQSFAEALGSSHNGYFTVLTAEAPGRIMAFSQKKKAGNGPALQWKLLDSIDSIVIPPVQKMAKKIKKKKYAQGDKPFRFSSLNQIWWGSADMFPISADQSIRLCILIPESDVVLDFKKSRNRFITIIVAVFIVGLIHALYIASRLSRPVESLVSSSGRISRGDLSDGMPIKSNIYEVQMLAQAHETMRNGLKALLKMEKEIHIASDIQQRTIPLKLPEVSGFQLAGWSSPMDATGGDTYDVVGYRVDEKSGDVTICEENADRAVLLLGDATGHGIGPALSITQMRSMLRMGVRLNHDLSRIVEQINSQLNADLPPGRFISAWFSEIDGRHNTLHYFSAGQAPLFYFNARTGRVDVLSADIYPLGIVESLKPSAIRKIEMSPGDMFAAMSDGILEAVNRQGEFFGTKNVISLLVRFRSHDPGQIIQRIRTELDIFTGGRPASDDRTIIIIKRER